MPSAVPIVIAIVLIAGAGGGGYVLYEDVKSGDMRPADIASIAESASTINQEQLNISELVALVCEFFDVQYSERVKLLITELDVQVYGINDLTVADVLAAYTERCALQGYSKLQAFDWESTCFNASGFFARGPLHGRIVLAVADAEVSGGVVCERYRLPEYDVYLVLSNAFLYKYYEYAEEFGLTGQVCLSCILSRGE